jgi:site-specific recombinase XerD
MQLAQVVLLLKKPHATMRQLARHAMTCLQHYLGHASITNTVRYTAMSPEPFKDIWRE